MSNHSDKWDKLAEDESGLVPWTKRLGWLILVSSCLQLLLNLASGIHFTYDAVTLEGAALAQVEFDLFPILFFGVPLAVAVGVLTAIKFVFDSIAKRNVIDKFTLSAVVGVCLPLVSPVFFMFLAGIIDGLV
jgi:hypothetical protein